MTDWEKIRRSLALSPIKAAPIPAVSAEQRSAAMQEQFALLQRGEPLCALCCNILGKGADCYRCARFA